MLFGAMNSWSWDESGKGLQILYGNHTSVKNISWVKRVLDSNPKSLRNAEQVYQETSFRQTGCVSLWGQNWEKTLWNECFLEKGSSYPFANEKWTPVHESGEKKKIIKKSLTKNPKTLQKGAHKAQKMID